MLLVDPASSAVTWSAKALTLSWGAAPVPTAQPDIYWMVANPGRCIRIDLAAREITQVLQVTTGYTSSTPVLVGSGHHQVLVTGAKDGALRGLVGMDKALEPAGFA